MNIGSSSITAGRTRCTRVESQRVQTESWVSPSSNWGISAHPTPTDHLAIVGLSTGRKRTRECSGKKENLDKVVRSTPRGGGAKLPRNHSSGADPQKLHLLKLHMKKKHKQHKASRHVFLSADLYLPPVSSLFLIFFGSYTRPITFKRIGIGFSKSRAPDFPAPQQDKRPKSRRAAQTGKTDGVA